MWEKSKRCRYFCKAVQLNKNTTKQTGKSKINFTSVPNSTEYRANLGPSESQSLTHNGFKTFKFHWPPSSFTFWEAIQNLELMCFPLAEFIVTQLNSGTTHLMIRRHAAHKHHPPERQQSLAYRKLTFCSDRFSFSNLFLF